MYVYIAMYSTLCYSTNICTFINGKLCNTKYLHVEIPENSMYLLKHFITHIAHMSNFKKSDATSQCSAT